MVSIRGRYEYDDEDLTPGKKKGTKGGLSQNLYDTNGDLKSAASFIPDDPNAEPEHDDPSVIYIETAPPVKSKEQEVFEQAIQEQISRFIDYGLATAKPHLQRVWRERARPAIQSKWEQRPRLRRANRQLASGGASVAAMRVMVAEEIKDASAEYRQNPTSTEAQARLMMAMFMRALSDEQLDLVANAEIVLDEGYEELECRLAELPAPQVARMIEDLEASPSLLTDGTFDLGMVLGLGPADKD